MVNQFGLTRASTKGNTLLQYFGLDNSCDGIAERNTDKWG